MTEHERPEDEDPTADEKTQEVPDEAVEEAERLTRLAREAVDDEEREAYRDRRETVLAEHDFTARVRHEESREVLVLHPDEWIADGSVDPQQIEDLDRAIEVPLSGPGDPDEWEAVDERNREIVERVRSGHGDVHGDNAAALADFMGNHYAKPIEDATGDELREFLDEYFPRNAFPSDEQRAVIGRSVELTFDAADEPLPEF